MVAENTIATDKPKVMGLEWDPNADTISFPLMKVVSEAKALHDQLTKRSVLSVAAKVFDPRKVLSRSVIVVAVAHGRPRNYANLSTIKVSNSSLLAYGLVYGL